MAPHIGAIETMTRNQSGGIAGGTRTCEQDVRASLRQQHRVMVERHAVANLELARLGHLLDGAGIPLHLVSAPANVRSAPRRVPLRPCAAMM